jgi:hypothetical protein
MKQKSKVLLAMKILFFEALYQTDGVRPSKVKQLGRPVEMERSWDTFL